MRFLNTHTLKFEQIPDSELHLEENQYAILSHRWGANKDEVSFEDIQSSAEFSSKKGFNKIRGFCEVAISENCRYGWADTCCINKGDAVELSEAINSMYQWYKGSKICIAYLEDVPQKQLTDSHWFDRGWTLQELISPKAVTFFDHDWNIVGTKIELIADLSHKTGIPKDILSHTTKPSSCSVAQRMSWAANRITTRVEDRAYSLMGLFDINMPMIYGEREKAFLRLQQQIIQMSKDESIFAWDMEFPGATRIYSGLFAPSPSAFAKCSNIIQTQGSRGFSESNGELTLWTAVSQRGLGTSFATLHCTDRAHLDCISYILMARAYTEGEYVRVRNTINASRGLVQIDRQTRFLERQIRVSVDPTQPPMNIFNGFWLRTVQPPGHDQCHTIILSNSQTSNADYISQHEHKPGVIGIIHMKPMESRDHSGWCKIHWITFGFDEFFNPVIWLANDKHSSRLRNAFEQAVASGNNYWERQQLMETCKNDIENKRDTMEWRLNVDHVWISRKPDIRSNGALVITVDGQKGIRGRVIEDLNLKISVQLQPLRSPTSSFTTNTADSGQSLNPTDIWTVEITGADGESAEETAIRLKKSRNRTRNLAIFGIILMICVVAVDVGTQSTDPTRTEIGMKQHCPRSEVEMGSVQILHTKQRKPEA